MGVECASLKACEGMWGLGDQHALPRRWGFTGCGRRAAYRLRHGCSSASRAFVPGTLES